MSAEAATSSKPYCIVTHIEFPEWRDNSDDESDDNEAEGEGSESGNESSDIEEEKQPESGARGHRGRKGKFDR